MKAFLAKLGLFTAIQVAVAAVFFLSVRVDEGSYLAATFDKHALLESAPSPRIIFVGGSSTAMGIDCPTVREILPEYHPVNMGLNAFLGLEFMLGEVSDDIRRGDVIVLSPEYELFLRDPGTYTVFEVVDMRPQSLAYLGWKKTADLGLVYFGRLAHNGIKGLKGRKSSKAIPPYTRDGFDAYGDLVSHRTGSVPRPPALRVQYLGLDPQTPAWLDEMIDRLNEFSALCARRGARVVFVYPPFAESHFKQFRPAIMTIADRLEAGMDIPILNIPREAVEPDEQFFDSSYHLIGSGAVARSREIAVRLKVFLQRSEGN